MTYSPQGTIKGYVNKSDASFSKQAVSTTIVELNSTKVEYTPTALATAVIYDVTFAIAWSPDRRASFMSLRLQTSNDDSTWTDVDGCKAFCGDGYTNDDTNWHFMSAAFTLTPWTGKRYLRLAARARDTSSEFTWGRSYTVAQGEGNGFAPKISVYSVET